MVTDKQCASQFVSLRRLVYGRMCTCVGRRPRCRATPVGGREVQRSVRSPVTKAMVAIASPCVAICIAGTANTAGKKLLAGRRGKGAGGAGSRHRSCRDSIGCFGPDRTVCWEQARKEPS